jgi:hypothetical protein
MMRMDGVLISGVIVVGNAIESIVSRPSTSEGMLPFQVEAVRQQEHFRSNTIGKARLGQGSRQRP